MVLLISVIVSLVNDYRSLEHVPESAISLIDRSRLTGFSKAWRYRHAHQHEHSSTFR